MIRYAEPETRRLIFPNLVADLSRCGVRLTRQEDDLRRLDFDVFHGLLIYPLAILPERGEARFYLGDGNSYPDGIRERLSRIDSVLRTYGLTPSIVRSGESQ